MLPVQCTFSVVNATMPVAEIIVGPNRMLFFKIILLQCLKPRYAGRPRYTEPSRYAGRPRYTQPSSFPSSSTLRRPGFSVGSRSGYLSGFTNLACAPSVASWQDFVSNEQVLKTASLPSIQSILLPVQLRWAGHVTRMEDVCMPKSSFLQRAPRRKARSWCSKKALQRPAEETASTGGNQPSDMAAGGPQTETVGTHQ